MHFNLHFYLHITIFTPYKRLCETPPPLDKGRRRVGWLFVIRSSADHSTKWGSRKLSVSHRYLIRLPRVVQLFQKHLRDDNESITG